MSEVHRETHRRVKNLIAAKSMKRKAIGGFASLMSSIPVARAQDDAKSGSGEIWISEDDPLLVQGESTKFLTEVGPKMQLLLPKSTGLAVGNVVEVISDNELRVKKEFGGDSGKGTLRIREQVEKARQAGRRGLSYKILPFVDQQEMYANVFKCLKEGGCIGIFPEGGSHDRTDLLPLKAGVALMALGAMEHVPGLQVRIVPVGLSYFHPHRFRSRAVVEFGPALDIPRELLDQFSQGGNEKRKASGKLLDMIYDALKTVTIRAPDYETLMVIQAARRLYKTPGQHLTLGQVVELNKRFIEGYMHFQHEPRVQRLRESVIKYNRRVRDLGLRDHQVPRAKRADWKTLSLLLYRTGLLSVWTVLALPGVVLNGPIFLLASVISRRKAKEALAASDVKIAGRDVLATWKILISLGVTPFLYAFYAILATIVAVKANVPLKWRLWTPFVVIAALPCIGFAALKFGEAGMDVLKSLRPLVVSLVPGQQRLLDQLKTQRIALSNELTDVINEFGPQMYEDFDEWRILVPSASAPPSGGQQGLWRRKSATGAVDAQGWGFSHPMTWLDERLFGWSRSAHRGTSAWGGPSSLDTSQAATPDNSDDEEGDYDNVIDYLGSYVGTSTSRSKSKSLRGSYADLQQFKSRETASEHTEDSPQRSRPPLSTAQSQYAPVYQKRPIAMRSPSSPASSQVQISDVESTDSSGFNHRIGLRERKSSLSDRVAVEKIGELDPTDTFKHATEELNRDIAGHS
ncbi:glycerol-3-phosphate O-acyltransferase [Ramaria rubella]|nr:glycerol-3-phosphate O-acyltransferase [Ramaria rubella]